MTSRGHRPSGSQRDGSPDTGPIRILTIDVEDPLPAFVADDRYARALVVLRRGRTPFAAVELDLDGGQLSQLAERLALGSESDTSSPAPDSQAQKLPPISVVVPTIASRMEELTRCCALLADQQYPDFEVLVVDNRTGEHPPLILDEIPGAERIRIICESRPGISAARNAGLAVARGEIVAFTDDDVQPDPSWLLGIGRRFAAQAELDAVTGLILPAELETPSQIWFERYYGGFSGQRSFHPVTLRALTSAWPWSGGRVAVTSLSGEVVRSFATYGVGAYGAGANMAFRRESVIRAGLFDPALGTGTPARGGEDLAMLISILWSGGRIGFEPSAVVRHRHRREYRELLDQLTGNGLGFTAMLTSLVLNDPRHLAALAFHAPLALRRVLVSTAERVRGRQPDPAAELTAGPRYPRELVMRELRGYSRGPLAYLASRRALRRGLSG
ncbi:MAG: hypothetical protein QOK10_431 [Pseudonocardiales bacterium]|jgi:hypothetical protein|nr:hypothetical protein [Pseudonocardiales bacterium]